MQKSNARTHAAIFWVLSTALAAPMPSHAQNLASPAVSTSASAPMSDGEVRKVDKEAGKLTLRHGRIENLDMPGMTMVFRVADPSMLETLKEGDKIRFAADRLNGALTVIRWEPTSPP